jgi:hypothetical protein
MSQTMVYYLLTKHLRDDEDHERTENATSPQQIDQRITGRCKQRRAKYEHSHFLTPSNQAPNTSALSQIQTGNDGAT